MTHLKREGGKDIPLSEAEEADRLSRIPTAEKIITAKIQEIEDALDALVDDVAKAKGYGKKSVTPTASCLGYAGYNNPHRANAEAFGLWSATLYGDALQIQADYLYGLIDEPTLEEVVAQMEPMEWPI